MANRNIVDEHPNLARTILIVDRKRFFFGILESNGEKD